MPSVQIKDVPPEVHAVLRRHASAAHQSLQEYLLTRLIEDASELTLDEALARINERSGGSAPFDVVATLVREDRDRH